MDKKELIKATTRKRKINKINSNFIHDYEDYIDDYINGTTSKESFTDKVKKYLLSMTPLVVTMFEKNYSVNYSVTNKLNTDRLVNNNVNVLENKLNEVNQNMQIKLEELKIDNKSYNKFRNSGLNIIQSLSLSNLSNDSNFAILSEKLYLSALENYISQIEASSDFEYNKILTDGDGNLLYTMKKWLWSHYDKTRHSGMDNIIVPIDEPFIVINDITGDEDEMMYPRDAMGSPSNTYNCQCELTYGNEIFKL